ncbi:MAG: hypothetical protein AVDCRST_MAG91-1537 [uncultured Sphingomonadaceae bacterium]|uniref:Uncharacterized protein n=1 Tax=uncultured Sphingomonadaceae bacterium TaxID=169976 RepID=A0A6J4SZY4_9SPHN|nr:MAG: hypothetical protein AVDCRST_MAG91-1537 [uncultured Sphingomonadaceae bacterium]
MSNSCSFRRAERHTIGMVGSSRIGIADEVDTSSRYGPF